MLQTAPHRFLLLQLPDFRKRRVKTSPRIREVDMGELTARLSSNGSCLDTMADSAALHLR